MNTDQLLEEKVGYIQKLRIIFDITFTYGAGLLVLFGIIFILFLLS
ncbi:MAG: hypothetical protein JSW11_09955 [Candidatus Heimdallarchaeota archaeon]|nr:MAG: hypothetical protein JSW11_09955 [Candidatus Heimdallarchaeota archaeon]